MADLDKNALVVYGLEREFAQTLQNTLTQVFKVDSDQAYPYLRYLESAKPSERLLALHESPLDVASSITGLSITPEMLNDYNRVLLVQDIAPISHYLEFRGNSLSSVPASAAVKILSFLGYKKSEPFENFDVWELSDECTPELPLRRRVLLPPPRGFVTDGTPTYDRDFLVSLVSHLSFGRLSEEPGRMLLRALDI
jgi:hypothetical protein